MMFDSGVMSLLIACVDVSSVLVTTSKDLGCLYCVQVRHMSAGRKNFITDLLENIRNEMAKNKEMKVCRLS